MCQRIPAAIANDDPKDEWVRGWFFPKYKQEAQWCAVDRLHGGEQRCCPDTDRRSFFKSFFQRVAAAIMVSNIFITCKISCPFSIFVGKEADLILSLCGLWDVDCPSSEHQKSDLHAPSLTGIATLQCYYHVEWIQIHKYKHTNTNTQIQIHKSKIWVNTSSRGRPLWLWTIAHLFFAQLLKHNANVNP